MELTPEEEDRFSTLVGQFDDPDSSSTRRSLVVVSIAIVAVAASGAALIGVPGGLLALFGMSFAGGLAAGLSAIAASDRRRRRS